MKASGSARCDASPRPYPEEVTRGLLRVTVSKDGRGHERLLPSFETGRAEEARAPPQTRSSVMLIGFAPRKRTTRTLSHIDGARDDRSHIRSVAGRRPQGRLLAPCRCVAGRARGK